MPAHSNGRTGAAAIAEVLLAFTRLGVTAFGGPVAHLGYFREEFVVRRRWLDEHAYADLVALCQFLPGPASSQVGFSLGLLRAGYAGGIAAWVGFTLPSAVLMVLFASVAGLLEGPSGSAALHGLQLVAVAIVAQAVWGMARSLCPDWPRAFIAISAAVLSLLAPSALTQMMVIALGGALGSVLNRPTTSNVTADHALPLVSRRVGLVALALFMVLLAGLPMLRELRPDRHLALFEAFYRSGALVFGGGHVVLPLLSEAVVTPGWVSSDAFLAGYGAAQAVPGPLFTFAAYLGAMATQSSGVLPGAALGLAGIFMPGLLILLAALPFWESLRRRTAARSVMAGVNAAVVGLLAASLYSHVWTGSVQTVPDVALAIGGALLLIVWRLPALLIVMLTVAGCWLAAQL